MSTYIALSGEALFGKIRRELLCLFFLNPDRSFYLLELVAILQTGRGGVQRELANLTESGIIRREKTGVKTFFRVADDSAIFVQMRDILEKITDIRNMISSAVKSADKTIITAILSPIILSGSTRSVRLLIVCDEINDLFQKEMDRVQLLTGIEIQMEIVRQSELSAFINEHSSEEWISPGTGFLLAGRPEDLIPEKSDEESVIREPDLFSGSDFNW
ncbi:MAG: winged helix-turn-helix transcriptional regulator [Candidatus Aegiribacteria sp.]|nr:winged helix-turn-helix transcriptional regulator [Candidatus Aegiribacteria sp.]